MPNFAIANAQKGKYQSGQMGQTVNLLAYAFGGSNPSLPTFRRKSFSVLAPVAFVVRSQRVAFSLEGGNESNDANGASNKGGGERNVATPILSRGKKKNKGPVKHRFHRAFVVWGREVFSEGLSE